MAESSRKWRIAFFLLLAFSLLSIGTLLYGFVDQAVTISYMTDGYDRTKRDLTVLAEVFPRDLYGKKDILVLLRRQNSEALIVETECTIQLNGIRFEFGPSGNLTGINERAEYSPELECDR